jgi:hypothetical protein
VGLRLFYTEESTLEGIHLSLVRATDANFQRQRSSEWVCYLLYMSAIISTSSSAASCWALSGSISAQHLEGNLRIV